MREISVGIEKESMEKGREGEGKNREIDRKREKKKTGQFVISAHSIEHICSMWFCGSVVILEGVPGGCPRSGRGRPLAVTAGTWHLALRLASECPTMMTKM